MLLDQVESVQQLSSSQTPQTYLIEVIFAALHLLIELSGFVSEIKGKLLAIAKNSRLPPLLAVSLRSSSPDIVALGFEMMRFFGNLKDFDSTR